MNQQILELAGMIVIVAASMIFANKGNKKIEVLEEEKENLLIDCSDMRKKIKCKNDVLVKLADENKYLKGLKEQSYKENYKLERQFEVKKEEIYYLNVDLELLKKEKQLSLQKTAVSLREKDFEIEALEEIKTDLIEISEFDNDLLTEKTKTIESLTDLVEYYKRNASFLKFSNNNIRTKFGKVRFIQLEKAYKL